MDRLECNRMFVAVADHGSFAEAARRFGVSSGQASKLVARLEKDLGVQLFKRTTRALSLTEVGQAYHARIKALLDEFDSLDASVRNVSGAPAGRLRITAPLSFGRLRLMPLLLDFARAYPDIRLDVDLTDQLRNLVDDGYDVAIRIGKPSDSSMMARKLCGAGILLVAAPAYLAHHERPRDPQELPAHSIIVDTNFRDAQHWHFRHPGSAAHIAVPINATMRLSNGEACLAAAEGGLGIAQIPGFIAHESVREGRLVRLLPEWEDEPFGVYAMYPPARHLALKVRALVDFLVTSLAGEDR